MNDSQDIYTSEADFKKRYEYNPSDLLGEGGFAQVYRAFDKQFQIYVALKFYNKGEKGKYDVLHEMKDAREFSHKNIIRVHDAFVVKFEHTGTYNFVQVGVLEFANGGNLRDFIDTKPSEHRFIEVLIGILEGIGYLHKEKNIIHRDLSPENILMFIEGDRWVPKIADFGISKKIDYSSLTTDQKKSTQLLGKIDYMAPEQFYPDKFGINGKINTQVDLWAFGVILYELFMKRTPFSVGPDSNPMVAIQNITNNPIQEINEIPEPYRTIIARCLEKEASKRVRTAEELISILEGKNKVPHTEPVATIPVNIEPKKRSLNMRWVWLSAALIVLIIAGYFAVNTLVRHKTNYTNQLAKINELISKKNYGNANAMLMDLPEETKKLSEFDNVKYKLNIWSLMQNKEYEKALGSFGSSSTDDPDLNTFYQQCQTLFADSLSDLIESKKLSEARSYYRKLNEPHNLTPGITGLFNQLQQLSVVDSLIRDGNAMFEKQDFNAAKASFNMVLEYDQSNSIALSMIEKINGIKTVPGANVSSEPKQFPGAKAISEPKQPVSNCIKEFSGTSLKIKQKPPESSLIKLVSICMTESEMRIRLEIRPSDYPVRIFGKGSPHAFFVQYDNKSKQLPLKDIRGIGTNSDVMLTKTTQFELIFDKLPQAVGIFNLLEGQSQLDETQTYWNFIGVELIN
jgi:serine/threonine protein kinase